jgi:hypothetical protein
LCGNQVNFALTLQRQTHTTEIKVLTIELAFDERQVGQDFVLLRGISRRLLQ